MTRQTDCVFEAATVIDGSGASGFLADVLIAGDRIVDVVPAGTGQADAVIPAAGFVLAPGFIDAHTHDDLVVIHRPDMLPKLSQGVTTVIVGNCGISAGAGILPVDATPPEPMALLGPAGQFRYPDFASWVAAVRAADPATNVAALVGHTALRAAAMEQFDRPASSVEIDAMRESLSAALQCGAIGLSTGLAYDNAAAAPTQEVMALAGALTAHGGLYATHLRDETAGILEALDEAFSIGRAVKSPVIVSHLKCAGSANHGRSGAVLNALERAARGAPVGCDCYPYTASASLLDLKQVVPETPILITWSDPEPGQAGRMLADIAADWSVSLSAAARRLQPAGAVYHCMDSDDVNRILAHPLTMIGSDGLPVDPKPHPRLWGAFARVLGHYARDRALFPLETAVRKMTGLTADRFGLTDRGYIRPGMAADLVLFDPARIADSATYEAPTSPATGIAGVWVNGVHSYDGAGRVLARAGRFLPRSNGSLNEEMKQ